MRHPTPRQFSGALLGALAVMLLQSCKRIDTITAWEPTNPSPTAYLEDGVLTSRVRAALILSPVVNSFNIGVETHQGVVLLSGMAADPTQIDLAVFVAQTVPGVSSVNNFMFSSDQPSGLNLGKGYTPDPGSSHIRRPLGNLPHPEPTGREGPTSASGPPVVSLSHPLPPENWQPADSAPRQSRWVTLAHGVLGIRSIQEELLIKQ